MELPSWRGRPKPGRIVRRGDEVVLLQPEDFDEPPIPPELEPRLLHLDDDLIAVDKPAGLSVHASRQVVNSHLIGWLRERYGESVALAHRLDRETSGVVLCTRHSAAARALGAEFVAGRVHKQYLAVVEGRPDAELTVDAPIGQDIESPVFVKQAAGVVGGAPSRTRFRRERQLSGERALVRAWPETGRRHQIRVHLAAAGHPIVGDKLYRPDGDRLFLRWIAHGLDATMEAELGAARQLLHAAVLSVRHPTSGDELRIEAPLPADMAAAAA